MNVSVRVEGLRELEQALDALPKRATALAVVRRVLKTAAEPVASAAAGMAPHRSGRLAFSIAISPQLTRRHRGEKVNPVEMHIGPAGGFGALIYAAFDEFGTVDTAAQPFMRPTWDANKLGVLTSIKVLLGTEIERTASRLARRTARLAGG